MLAATMMMTTATTTTTTMTRIRVQGVVVVVVVVVVVTFPPVGPAFLVSSESDSERNHTQGEVGSSDRDRESRNIDTSKQMLITNTAIILIIMKTIVLSSVSPEANCRES